MSNLPVVQSNELRDEIELRRNAVLHIITEGEFYTVWVKDGRLEISGDNAIGVYPDATNRVIIMQNRGRL